MLAVARSKTGELMPELELLRRLEIVRMQGFEEMPSLQISGVHNFSFPVFGVDGRAVAAMTMPFLLRSDLPSTSMDDARVILREAAEELSAHLGHIPVATSS
jgi:DNA-binding IclR family transcriptional regulator